MTTPPSGATPPNVAPARADLRLLLPALAAWALDAALLGQPPPVLAVGWAALALMGVTCGWVMARRGESLGAVVALTLVVSGLVVGSLGFQQGLRSAGPVQDLAAERAVVEVIAVVDGEPRVVTGRVGDPTGIPRVLVQLLVRDVTGRGERASVATPVLLMGGPEWADLRWRTEVRAKGRLTPSDPAERSVAVLRAIGPPRVLDQPGVVFRLADHVRERLREASSGLPADARGLLPGLVLGDTSQTPADLTADMRATGLTHLSAVSGSNVAIILAAALALCRWTGVRRRWRPVSAMTFLVLFVIVVRPDPSVVRAASMGVVGLIGMTVDRRRAGLPALAGAVVALLVWDPWLARSAGFALSTLASLGLLVFARSWGQAFARRLPGRLGWLGPMVAVPVAAQVMCAPVIVVLQGSVSMVSVLANLLAAPFVAPATVMGVIAAVVASVWPAGGAAVAWLAGLPTLGIAQVARRAADIPGGVLPWPDGAPGAWLLAGLTVAAFVGGRWAADALLARPLLLAALLLMGPAAALPTYLLTWPMDGWQVAMCDVGQGDALVVRTGPGQAILVDTGPDPPGVDACLSRLGVSVLDAVVLTHFHADHVDGLTGALHGRSVGQILVTPVRDPDLQARQVDLEAAEAGVPVRTLYAGDTLDLAGAVMRVWWPQRVIHDGSIPNNASLVLTVTVDALRALFLGDVEAEAAHEVLRALQQDGGVLRAGFDVVKVAHHGSANRDDALMAAVTAPVALVSVGVDNNYGHPSPSTMAALQRLGYMVLRSDESGDVAVRRTVDGQVLVSARGR